MRSWVFRYRQRLRVVYGPPEPLLPITSSAPPQTALPESVRGRAGTLERRGQFLVLHPMPARVLF